MHFRRRQRETVFVRDLDGGLALGFRAWQVSVSLLVDELWTD